MKGPAVRTFIRVITYVVIAITLSGCGALMRLIVDPAVKKEFPPVSIEDAKADAIRKASQSLALLQEPGILMNVSRAQVTEAFESAVRVHKDAVVVKEVSVDTAEQALLFRAKISAPFNAQGISGQFEAQIEGEAIVEPVPGSPVLAVRPVFRSARLVSLDLDNWSFASDAIKSAINSVLRRYLNSFNSTVPALRFPIDPSTIGLSSVPQDIDLGNGRIIRIPAATIGVMSPLIDADGIHVLAEISLSGLRTPATNLMTDFEVYRREFWNRAASVYAALDRNTPGLFVADRIVKMLLQPAFPPLPLADLQTVALADLREAVKAVRIVAAGVYVEPKTVLSTVERFVSAGLANSPTPPGISLKFGDVRAGLDQQSIILNIPVEGAFAASQGQTSLSLRFKGSATIAGLLSQNGRNLYYRTAMVGLRIDDVEHTGKGIDPSAFMVAINHGLDQLIPYLNNLAPQGAISVDLPKLEPIPAPSGTALAPTTLVPPKINAVGLFPRIDANGIRMLVSEAEGATTEDIASKPADEAFRKTMEQAIGRAFSAQSRLAVAQVMTAVDPDLIAAVDRTFIKAWTDGGLPVVGLSGRASGSLSVKWVAGKLGEFLAINNVSLTVPFDGGSRFGPADLKLGAPLKAGCNVRDRYQRAACARGGCSRGDSCAWDCTRCFSYGLGRACADDPICLAGRAACNLREEAGVAACNAREEANVLACNVREETNQGIWDVARNLEMTACVLTEELVNAINGLATLGRIHGDVEAHGRALINNPALTYDDAARRIRLSFNAQADISASGSLHYDPAGVLGAVLICPIPGQVSFRVNGAVATPSRAISASIGPASGGISGALLVNVRFEPVIVTAQVTPPPLEAILVQNPQIEVLCSPFITGPMNAAWILGKVQAFSGLDVVGAVARAIPNVPGEARDALLFLVNGSISRTVEIPQINLPVPDVTLNVGATTMGLSARWVDDGIVLRVD